MNLKKGLFRIWLVFSIPWVLFFCVVYFLEHYYQFDKYKLWALESTSELLNIVSKLHIEDEPPDLEKLEALRKVEKEIKLRAGNIKNNYQNIHFNEEGHLLIQLTGDNTTLDFPENITANGIHNGINSRVKELRIASIKKDLHIQLFLTFLPPIILFVIGSAALWVLSGFKEK